MTSQKSDPLAPHALHNFHHLTDQDVIKILPQLVSISTRYAEEPDLVDSSAYMLERAYSSHCQLAAPRAWPTDQRSPNSSSSGLTCTESLEDFRYIG